MNQPLTFDSFGWVSSVKLGDNGVRGGGWFNRPNTHRDHQQPSLPACLPGSDHQDVHSLCSGLGEQPPPPHKLPTCPFPVTHTLVKGSCQHAIQLLLQLNLHLYTKTCSKYTRGVQGDILWSSCALLQQCTSSAPLRLSWSSLWLVCPAPGPAAPGRAAGYCSRSYRRGWAQTAAGLALGSSGRSSWRRTRYHSSCSRTQTGHHCSPHTLQPPCSSFTANKPSTGNLLFKHEHHHHRHATAWSYIYLKLAHKC